MKVQVNISIAFVLFISMNFSISYAQSISINENGTAPNASAMLDVSDTTKGILIPRLTFVQRNAISNPATGLLVYQVDSVSGFYYNQGIPSTPTWLRINTEVDSTFWSKKDTNLYFNSGFVGVGTDKPQGLMHLYGKGSLGAGGRLVFGDDYLSSSNNWNTFIGELGWDSLIDSDRLQIHGANGTYFTNGANSNNSYDTSAIISSFGISVIGDSTQVGMISYNDSSYWALFSDQKGGILLPQGSFGLYGGHKKGSYSIRWMIDKEGKMGIGNNAPKDALQVGSFLENQDQFLSIKTNGGNQFKSGIKLLNFADDDGFTLVSDETVNKFFIQSHSADTTNAFTIDRLTSNVGIGTETPSQKLDVNGGAEINYLGLNGTALSNVPLRVTAAVNNLAMRFDQNDGTAKWEIFADANSLNFCESSVSCNRLVLETGGDVGIGRFPSYKLDVNGSIRANATVYASDRRLKTDIKAIKNVLSSLDQITGVYHYWDTINFPERNYTDKKTIGVIAQDIQKVYPELVQEDVEGYLSVDYPKFTAVLLQAIKEQQKEIELLKANQSDAKLQQIENENLRLRLEKLEEILIKK